MEVFCTYCSATKHSAPGLMPALERYQSARIQRVASLAEAAAAPFLILSGKYGLLDSHDPVPWYDHLLAPEEVDDLSRVVAAQMQTRAVKSMRYFTEPLSKPLLVPYADVVRKASLSAGVELQIVTLEGRNRTMSDWRAITAAAEQAKRAMIADRKQGDEQFSALLRVHPGDGMIFLKRGEAYEAVGDVEAATADYLKARALLPMPAWKSRAQEGIDRCARTAVPDTRRAAAAGAPMPPDLVASLPSELRGPWRSALEAPTSAPSARVTLYRVAVERSIDYLLNARGISCPPRSGLLEQIRLLQERGVVQASTVSHMHTVRTLGNEAAHGGGIGDDEADACRIAGQAILKAVIAALS